MGEKKEKHDSFETKVDQVAIDEIENKSGCLCIRATNFCNFRLTECNGNVLLPVTYRGVANFVLAMYYIVYNKLC